MQKKRMRKALQTCRYCLQPSDGVLIDERTRAVHHACCLLSNMPSTCSYNVLLYRLSLTSQELPSKSYSSKSETQATTHVYRCFAHPENNGSCQTIKCNQCSECCQSKNPNLASRLLSFLFAATIAAASIKVAATGTDTRSVPCPRK